jgi:hypothetical protein
MMIIKPNMKSSKVLFAFVLLLSPGIIFAQEKADSLKKEKKDIRAPLLSPLHKNTIKFNPTPMLLFSEVRNITFSYERMIKEDQSIAVQAGYLLLPTLFNDTIARILEVTSHSKHGVNLAFDYRWYPGPRNRRPAPDGFYIGGFTSYNGYTFDNDFNILGVSADEQCAIHGNLNVVNLGMNLGYQFIFWERFSLDLLVFGPSFSLYTKNITLEGHLDPDQIDAIDQEVLDELMQTFPLIGTLFSEETLTFSGKDVNFGMGFRYSISIGYHFK